MALVTVADMKSVLGVGDLYPDATLQEVCDTADSIVKSYLPYNKHNVIAGVISNNVAIMYTNQAHGLTVGESVTLTNCGNTFNGSYTITNVTADSFDFAKNAANTEKVSFQPYGTAQGPLHRSYDSDPDLQQAALIIAVDVWQARSSAFGQPNSVDFQPTPYRVGQSLISRVKGLIAKHMDTGSMIG